jgi:hypothetical protein
MARTVILYADDGLALSEYENVFISILLQPSTLPRVREVRKHLDASTKRWGTSSCGFALLAQGAFALTTSKVVMDESAAIGRDYANPASTIVVESSGFAGSAIRAFFTGIAMVSPKHGRIHATVAEGVAWLAPIAASASKLDITAAGLERAVAQSRAAIGRPPAR